MKINLQHLTQTINNKLTMNINPSKINPKTNKFKKNKTINNLNNLIKNNNKISIINNNKNNKTNLNKTK